MAISQYQSQFLSLTLRLLVHLLQVVLLGTHGPKPEVVQICKPVKNISMAGNEVNFNSFAHNISNILIKK